MVRRRRGERGLGRRCAAAGCPRRAQAGRALCASHARGAEGRELEEAIGRMARQLEQAFRREGDRETSDDSVGAVRRQERALAAFGRRVEGGDFGELFDERLRAMLAESAGGRSLAVEIGALRVVMGRLLTDPELDASAQARGMARVVEMIVRAVRTQGELAAWAGEPGREEMRRVLAALEMRDSAWRPQDDRASHAKAN